MTAETKAATSFEEGLKGASEKVVEFHEERSALKSLQHWLHQTPSAVPMIVLVIVIVAASWLGSLLFGILWLITLPIQSLLVANVYRQGNGEAVAP